MSPQGGPTRRAVVAGLAGATLAALALPGRASAPLEVHDGWVLRAGDRARLAVR